jgi:hypothetical protein
MMIEIEINMGTVLPAVAVIAVAMLVVVMKVIMIMISNPHLILETAWKRLMLEPEMVLVPLQMTLLLLLLLLLLTMR